MGALSPSAMELSSLSSVSTKKARFSRPLGRAGVRRAPGGMGAGWVPAGPWLRYRARDLIPGRRKGALGFRQPGARCKAQGVRGGGVGARSIERRRARQPGLDCASPEPADSVLQPLHQDPSGMKAAPSPPLQNPHNTGARRYLATLSVCPLTSGSGAGTIIPQPISTARKTCGAAPAPHPSSFRRKGFPAGGPGAPRFGAGGAHFLGAGAEPAPTAPTLPPTYSPGPC